MNNLNRVLVEVKEEGFQLHVVAAKNGASKRFPLSAPVVLPSRVHGKRSRPELVVLGWGTRSTRLAGRK